MKKGKKGSNPRGRRSTNWVPMQDAHSYPWLAKFGGVKDYGRQEPADSFTDDTHH
jgi:hypothetical protein